MKLLITGASGFIGEAVMDKLVAQGHDLVLVSRTPSKLEKRYGTHHTYYQWDAVSGPPDKTIFEGIEGIINLMGEGVANKRWTPKQKQKISNTRVLGTHHLMDGAKKYASLLKVVVSASAIGYYNHLQNDTINEDAPNASSFLGKLCQNWEDAVNKMTKNAEIRTVILRIGVVLGEGGGALAKMTPPFSFGLGGKIGSGKQWMNWIHRDDLASMIVQAIEDQTFSGTYNAVAPESVQNKIFTKVLGSLLKRPTLFNVPAFAIKWLLGEFSDELLNGQKIISSRLPLTTFEFKYPTIMTALEQALSIKYSHHLGKKIRCFRFHCRQFLNHPQESVFNFFSNAQNLEKITPPFLKFKVTSQSTPKIENGTLFNYKLKIRGIPIRWCTLILDWNPIDSFVDTQLKGPYRVWHHTHRFVSYKGGTLVEDEVYYALPNIPFITILLGWYVRQDVEKIFQYRKKEIESIFEEQLT